MKSFVCEDIEEQKGDMHACIVQYTLKNDFGERPACNVRICSTMLVCSHSHSQISFSLSFSPPQSHSHSHPTFTLPSFYLTAVLSFTAHHDINILVACPAHRGTCLHLLLLLPLLILPRIPHFFFFSLLPQPLGRRRRRRTGVVVGLVAGV